MPLCLTAAVYVRGWLRLRRRGSLRFGRAQLVCFLAGIGGIAIALLSPLDAFAVFLLQMHMAQHLLLMLVIPPLIWLGDPDLPLLMGLPVAVRSVWIAPLLRHNVVHQGSAVSDPPACCLVPVRRNNLGLASSGVV